MKVLCISDEIDPLIYSPNAKERLRDIDFVISAGDLPMEYLGFICSMTCTPLYFVFGNHNLKYLKQFNKSNQNNPFRISSEIHSQNTFGANYINKRCIRHEDLLITGLGGCKKYNHGKNQFTEWQMLFRMLSLLPRLFINKLLYGRFVDIFVTHAPPRGINDRDDPCHQGFVCFRWFIKLFQPRYMMHGHVHLYEDPNKRKTIWENCEVINVFQSHTMHL